MVLFLFVPHHFDLSLWALRWIYYLYANSDVFCGQKIQGENWSSLMLESIVLGDQDSRSIKKMQEGNSGWYSFLVYLICRRVAGLEGKVSKWAFAGSIVIFIGCDSPFQGLSSLINMTSLWWSASDGVIIMVYLVIQWFLSLMAIRVIWKAHQDRLLGLLPEFLIYWVQGGGFTREGKEGCRMAMFLRLQTVTSQNNLQDNILNRWTCAGFLLGNHGYHGLSLPLSG